MEAEGVHFFNTFFLTTPRGEIAGTVRKQTPAAFEAFFTTGEKNDHFIDTDIGKIGVGICYENQLSFIPILMHKYSVDFMLMPHSAPTPMPVPVLSTEKNSVIFDDVLKNLAQNYAQLLGIPVILSNKCGKWETELPSIFRVAGKQKTLFPGLSSVADSDGTLKGQLGKNEGILVCDVVLDSALKKAGLLKCYGRRSFKKTWKDVMWLMYAKFGKKSYDKNNARVKKARMISKI